MIHVIMVVIYVKMIDNTHDNPYQLKLNDIDCLGFDA